MNRVISTLNRRAMRAEEGEVGHTRHDNTSLLTHSASYKADSAPLLQWSLLSPMCVCVCDGAEQDVLLHRQDVLMRK